MQSILSTHPLQLLKELEQSCTKQFSRQLSFELLPTEPHANILQQKTSPLTATSPTSEKLTKSPKSPKQKWSGLGFSVNKYKFCIASEHIGEILDSNFKQNLSAVPGAKSWLLGLISLRGQALPVIDLSQYLFGQPSDFSKKSRLLILKFSSMNTGLIINKTYGLLQTDNISTRKPSLDNPVTANLKFSDRTLEINKQFWIELSIHKLENDANFLSATKY